LGTKDVNLSLNQDLLVDAVNLIEDYAYGDNGNFSDWLTVRLFIPSYTVFADIVAGGVSDNGIIALIQDEDKVFVPMSDAGKSLVNLEIQLLQQQTPVWSLTKSPELRVIKKLQRDGADIPDDVFEIVTSRYENAQPYVKGDVFTRLFEINPYLGAEYVKMVNDHYS
jgi:hypothetical protein